MKLCVDQELRESASLASRQHSLQFEKTSIVRAMLNNYSQVTEEFYCEYGGHHENRDLRYLAQENSFSAGSHPRPSFFALVEFIVISTFRVITWLWCMFVWFSGIVITRLVASRNGPTSSPYSRRTVQKLSPPRKAVSRVDTLTLSLMEEGGESDDDETTSVTCSMSESASLTSVSSVSSTDSEVSTACTMSASSAAAASWSFTAMLDGPFVTGLSAGIISLIAWQCRIESNIRNSFKRCCRPRNVVRKRKNSSLPSPATLVRDRSSGSDCSDDSRADEILTRRPRRSPISNNGSLLESSP